MIFAEKENKDDLARLADLHERALSEERHAFRTQLERSEQERAKSLQELEKELVKQRERTLGLLAEKESELEILRGDGQGGVRKLLSNEENNEADAVAKQQQRDTDESESTVKSYPVVNNNNNNNFNKSENNNSILLYYNQQNAYKDTELNKLRVANKELEYKLKKTFDEHSVDLDRLQSQIGLLKDELERLKLNESRNEMNSSENLEYIKNVVFNYLTTKDQTVRVNMIGAIMQILKFSRSEKQKMQSLLASTSKHTVI